jgi:hypothetical protein
MGAQPEKLENIRIPDNLCGAHGFCLSPNYPGEAFFVPGQSGSFIIQTADLALQFPDGPVPPGAFSFIKRSHQGIFNRYKFLKMTVRQAVKKIPRTIPKLWGRCTLIFRNTPFFWKQVL